MKYGYWCVEALLGVALVVAPIVERFTSLHPASYTDVILAPRSSCGRSSATTG